jgi:hypothetical protein
MLRSFRGGYLSGKTDCPEHTRKGIIVSNGPRPRPNDEQGIEKPVIWVGSSLEDLKQFPKSIRQLFG